MTFINAKCELCGQRHDKPDNLLAFAVRHQALELIDLRGEQPWSGVRVVCRRCIRFFREATDASEAEKLAGAYRQIEALRVVVSNQRTAAAQGEHYRRAAQAFELAMLSLMRRLPKDDPVVIRAAKTYAEYDPHGCLRAPDRAAEIRSPTEEEAAFLERTGKLLEDRTKAMGGFIDAEGNDVRGPEPPASRFY